ncbi:helix-turn-helix domain-containing protein [Serratia fonticola]|uniref:winged helix-turn-helix transcriptional regulator n=1 Tax=Serratia fonticola TaxID=47917 RepID=UPI003AACCBE2
MKVSMVKSVKPTGDIKKLIDALIPFAKVQEILANKKIPYTNKRNCDIYLILEGRVDIHRVHDSMVMATAKAPVILGVTNQTIADSDEFFFSSKTRAVFGIIPMKTFKEVVEKAGLWGSYATYLTFIIKYMSVHSSEITALSAYEIIRNQLINLEDESDYFRLNANAAQYIQERTLLSRSGIMHVLSQLKKGGYIIIENGVLIKVIRLPQKY